MKVEIRTAGDAPCGQCASRLCITAHLPSGGRTVGLCPSCDSDTPQARELLEYFELHPRVRPEDVGRVSELLSHWLESATAETARGSLAADVAAWWSSRSR